MMIAQRLCFWEVLYEFGLQDKIEQSEKMTEVVDLSGSSGGIWTPDQVINSHLLYPWATEECVRETYSNGVKCFGQ